LASTEETGHGDAHGSMEVAAGRPGSGTRPGSATKRAKGGDGELLYKMISITGPDLV